MSANPCANVAREISRKFAAAFAEAFPDFAPRPSDYPAQYDPTGQAQREQTRIVTAWQESREQIARQHGGELLRLLTELKSWDSAADESAVREARSYMRAYRGAQ